MGTQPAQQSNAPSAPHDQRFLKAHAGLGVPHSGIGLGFFTPPVVSDFTFETNQAGYGTNGVFVDLPY